jgi:DDE superfamily endonuclease
MNNLSFFMMTAIAYALEEEGYDELPQPQPQQRPPQPQPQRKQPLMYTNHLHHYRNPTSIESIRVKLGDNTFHQLYRMEYSSFKELCHTLTPGLKHIIGCYDDTKSWAPNGRISMINIHVACTLRYFAGSSLHDIMNTFDISQPFIYDSIGLVVNAVNTCPSLTFKYPESRDEQKQIALGFQEKSTAGFHICAGVIDSLLIWIQKPSLKDCKETYLQLDQSQYFCERNDKWGLNMQAVCDHQGRFLDVSITSGGASPDFLAFEKSSLYHKLQYESLLPDGLCLLGSLAYINSFYMATPYPGTVSESKDAYNYYHSELHCTAACAFGRLVKRWGFLWKKAPQNFSISKIISTVVCLCQLHNFCINKSLQNHTNLNPPNLCDSDEAFIYQNGGIPMESIYLQEMDEEILIPVQLMDGGNHSQNLHNDQAI